MKNLISASLIALLAGTAVFAQETETKTEAAQQADAAFPISPAGNGANEPEAVFGDWELRCFGADEARRCVLVQFGKTDQGEILSRVTIEALPEDAEAAAGITVLGPLGVLLSAGLGFQVDDGRENRYPFQVCEQQGCIARFGITATEVEVMKGGAQLFMGVIPAVGNSDQLRLNLSLAEFTAAWEALKEN